jgi:hypothetical protein
MKKLKINKKDFESFKAQFYILNRFYKQIEYQVCDDVLIRADNQIIEQVSNFQLTDHIYDNINNK